MYIFFLELILRIKLINFNYEYMTQNIIYIKEIPAKEKKLAEMFRLFFYN